MCLFWGSAYTNVIFNYCGFVFNSGDIRIPTFFSARLFCYSTSFALLYNFGINFSNFIFLSLLEFDWSYIEFKDQFGEKKLLNNLESSEP